MTPTEVFALSDGNIFSVNKQTEEIKVYNRLSGLHGVHVSCIHYDERTEQLIIAYESGKIDLLSASGVRYVGDLYNKDMTQRKTIYNITLCGRLAYLSTHYGVQVFDLSENKFTDSYWLRPNGTETPIKDVLVANDSIYAFGEDSLYSAALNDNLVDYRYWHREARSERIQPDEEKGHHYQDTYDHWFASYAEGIVRFTPTDRLNYIPNGPLNNSPYFMTFNQGDLYVVPGGRWKIQYARGGAVMRYDGNRWENITSAQIEATTQKTALDFVNVAVDPKDKEHFFVTSYGTGLYEFQGKELKKHYLPSAENTLSSAVIGNENYYTRLDCATYDSVGRLWLMVAGKINPYQFVSLDEEGHWFGEPISLNGQQRMVETPADLIIDSLRPNTKWLFVATNQEGIYLLNDGGTPTDAGDDVFVHRNHWEDRNEHPFDPVEIRSSIEDREGRIWIGTEQGIAYINDVADFEAGKIVIPAPMDENGINPLPNERINALCEDAEGQIWMGTNTTGVFVLSADAQRVLAHYTIDNSAMPSNAILSLAIDKKKGVVYIGTAEGLVEFDPDGKPENLLLNEQEAESDLGSLQQWKLHYSYLNPQEIEGTPQHVYALASGALFSVDRSTNEIEYWNKSTGLNGNTVSHIAYDAASAQLVIGYTDGRIDLLAEDGSVRQMPDLYIKASSMAVTINDISVGSRATYLSMSYGILALNTKKAEISNTYFIGDEAAYVDVQRVVEIGDSLYAFTRDYLYSASLNDNLVDYSYWHKRLLPESGVSDAVVWRDELYTLQHDSLYRLRAGEWQLVAPNPLNWIHVSDGQLLTYQSGNGLLRLTEEDQFSGLTGSYTATDAIWTQGEYWLGDATHGLIRLNSMGDEFFLPECPTTNMGYRFHVANDRLYVASGGRWATQFGRQSDLNIYDGNSWLGIPWADTYWRTGVDIRDAVSYAVDPNDASHFFVGTFGTGVLEYRDNHAVAHYGTSNSTLREAKEGMDPTYFTRTEGLLWDNQDNLWVLNATELGSPVHVRTPNGIWHPLNLTSRGQRVSLDTPGAIWVDQRNSQWKWMTEQREEAGVILLDDGGTPSYGGDDRCLKRYSFTDQNGNNLVPSHVLCLTQDLNNRIWIGTYSGIIIIPSTTDFFSSDECRRIIIPRNDGTGLGDYLLGNERINCMAVDGGNRMWIGTASSGLYLIADDTITVAHFTADNSNLPSNTIQTIAIMPMTGEVFVGTDNGIASYRSDASAPREDFTQAYAFPNPVRPNYGGSIGIGGLMENTVVNIVDAGGNLVCKTRSNGGMAVWSGNLPDGRRATSGVYTALCNEPDGKHTVVKILFIQK